MANALSLIQELETNVLGNSHIGENSLKDKEFGEYVSQIFSEDYPLLSKEIYSKKRKVTLNLNPKYNSKMEKQFESDISVKQKYFENKLFSKTKPYIKIKIPIVFSAGIGESNLVFPVNAHPTIDYVIKRPAFSETKSSRMESRYSSVGAGMGVIGASEWLGGLEKTFGILIKRYGLCMDRVYGTNELTINGTWQSHDKVDKVLIQVPNAPREIIDLLNQAKLDYYQILLNIKRGQQNFSSKSFPDLEQRVLWVPQNEDFDLKMKSVTKVDPDPALILRIDKKYDHVVGTWQTSEKDPTEFIVRRYLKK